MNLMLITGNPRSENKIFRFGNPKRRKKKAVDRVKNTGRLVGKGTALRSKKKKKTARLSGKAFVAKMNAAKRAKKRAASSKRPARHRPGATAHLAQKRKLRTQHARTRKSGTGNISRSAHRAFIERAGQALSQSGSGLEIRENPRMRKRKRKHGSHRKHTTAKRRRRRAKIVVASNPRRKRRAKKHHVKRRRRARIMKVGNPRRRRVRRIRRRGNPIIASVESKISKILGLGISDALMFIGGGAAVQVLDELINAYAPASLVSAKKAIPFNESIAPIALGIGLHKLGKGKVKDAGTALVAVALMNIGQDLAGYLPQLGASQPAQGIQVSGKGQGDFRGIQVSGKGQGDFRGIQVSAKGDGDFQGTARAMGDFSKR